LALRPVALEWEGKKASLEGLDGPLPAFARAEIMEAKEPTSAQKIRLILGDALDVARRLAVDGLLAKVDLVYLDPPYGSGANYTHEERLEGRATGALTRAAAYRDTWEDGPASYLDMLYPRLAALRPLLCPTGSIWVQVDWRASHLVRALCDEIFGRDRFLNEIVWRRAPNLGRQARSGQFGRTLDTIVVYGGGREARLVPPTRLLPVRSGSAKKDPATGRYYTVAPRGDYTDESVARLETEGRIHHSPSGNVYVKYWLEQDEDGKLCKRQPIDTLWIDIPPLRHVSPEERTGYPTQKPRALLERIIAAGSPKGGVVVDLFAGSGTTGAAAAALGRKAVLADSSPVAVSIMRNRMHRAGIAASIDLCGAAPARSDRPASLDAAWADKGHVAVRLHCPAARDLLGWAVSVEQAEGEPLRPAFYAGRATGRRPAEMPLSAVI
jgi:adenine-specific DNA-methyltransferase